MGPWVMTNAAWYQVKALLPDHAQGKPIEIWFQSLP